MKGLNLVFLVFLQLIFVSAQAVTQDIIDYGALSVLVGDIDIYPNVYWSIINNVDTTIIGDLDVGSGGGFYVSSTSSLIGLLVNIKSKTVANAGTISFNSIKSLVPSNFDITAVTSFVNNGNFYMGSNGDVGFGTFTINSATVTNNGLMVFYQTQNKGGQVVLGGTNLVNGITNNGQICLFNELYVQASSINGKGCITAQANSTIVMTNPLAAFSGQNFYLADSDSSVIAAPYAGSKTINVYGFGNGNMIALTTTLNPLTTIPFVGTIVTTPFTYNPSTGLLTLYSTIANQVFYIGPGYKSGGFAVTTDWNAVGAGVVLPFNAVTYVGPPPSARPANCALCSTLPTAPGINGLQYTTTSTRISQDQICTDIDEIFITSDISGNFYNSTSLLSASCLSTNKRYTTHATLFTNIHSDAFIETESDIVVTTISENVYTSASLLPTPSDPLTAHSTTFITTVSDGSVAISSDTAVVTGYSEVDIYTTSSLFPSKEDKDTSHITTLFTIESNVMVVSDSGIIFSAGINTTKKSTSPFTVPSVDSYVLSSSDFSNISLSSVASFGSYSRSLLLSHASSSTAPRNALSFGTSSSSLSSSVSSSTNNVASNDTRASLSSIPSSSDFSTSSRNSLSSSVSSSITSRKVASTVSWSAPSLVTSTSNSSLWSCSSVSSPSFLLEASMAFGTSSSLSSPSSFASVSAFRESFGSVSLSTASSKVALRATSPTSVSLSSTFSSSGFYSRASSTVTPYFSSWLLSNASSLATSSGILSSSDSSSLDLSSSAYNLDSSNTSSNSLMSTASLEVLNNVGSSISVSLHSSSSSSISSFSASVTQSKSVASFSVSSVPSGALSLDVLNGINSPGTSSLLFSRNATSSAPQYSTELSRWSSSSSLYSSNVSSEQLRNMESTSASLFSASVVSSSLSLTSISLDDSKSTVTSGTSSSSTAFSNAVSSYGYPFVELSEGSSSWQVSSSSFVSETSSDVEYSSTSNLIVSSSHTPSLASHSAGLYSKPSSIDLPVSLSAGSELFSLVNYVNSTSYPSNNHNTVSSTTYYAAKSNKPVESYPGTVTTSSPDRESSTSTIMTNKSSFLTSDVADSSEFSTSSNNWPSETSSFMTADSNIIAVSVSGSVVVSARSASTSTSRLLSSEVDAFVVSESYLFVSSSMVSVTTSGVTISDSSIIDSSTSTIDLRLSIYGSDVLFSTDHYYNTSISSTNSEFASTFVKVESDGFVVDATNLAESSYKPSSIIKGPLSKSVVSIITEFSDDLTRSTTTPSDGVLFLESDSVFVNTELSAIATSSSLFPTTSNLSSSSITSFISTNFDGSVETDSGISIISAGSDITDISISIFPTSSDPDTNTTTFTTNKSGKSDSKFAVITGYSDRSINMSTSSLATSSKEFLSSINVVGLSHTSLLDTSKASPSIAFLSSTFHEVNSLTSKRSYSTSTTSIHSSSSTNSLSSVYYPSSASNYPYTTFSPTKSKSLLENETGVGNIIANSVGSEHIMSGPFSTNDTDFHVSSDGFNPYSTILTTVESSRSFKTDSGTIIFTSSTEMEHTRILRSSSGLTVCHREDSECEPTTSTESYLPVEAKPGVVHSITKGRSSDVASIHINYSFITASTSTIDVIFSTSTSDSFYSLEYASSSSLSRDISVNSLSNITSNESDNSTFVSVRSKSTVKSAPTTFILISETEGTTVFSNSFEASISKGPVEVESGLATPTISLNAIIPSTSEPSIDSSSSSHIFTRLESIISEHKISTSSELRSRSITPVTPLTPFWTATIAWQITPEHRVGFKFSLTMPGVFGVYNPNYNFSKRYSLGIVYLSKNDVKYAECISIPGSLYNDKTSLQCTMIVPAAEHITGTIEIPLIFNVGGSSSVSDIHGANALRVGTQLISFFTEDNRALSTEVHFNSGSPSPEDPENVVFSVRDMEWDKAQAYYLLGGNCPSSYGFGKLSLSIVDGILDCDTWEGQITNNLNEWYLPKSSENLGSISLERCDGNEIIVNYSNVPGGYRVFLDVIGQSGGYHLNAIYKDVHSCEEISESDSSSTFSGTDPTVSRNIDTDIVNGTFDATKQLYSGNETTQFTTLPSDGVNNVIVTTYSEESIYTNTSLNVGFSVYAPVSVSTDTIGVPFAEAGVVDVSTNSEGGAYISGSIIGGNDVTVHTSNAATNKSVGLPYTQKVNIVVSETEVSLFTTASVVDMSSTTKISAVSLSEIDSNSETIVHMTPLVSVSFASSRNSPYVASSSRVSSTPLDVVSSESFENSADQLLNCKIMVLILIVSVIMTILIT